MSSSKGPFQSPKFKPRMLDFLHEGQVSNVEPEEIPEDDRLNEPITYVAPGWDKFFLAMLDTPVPTGQMKNRKERYRPFVEALRIQIDKLGKDPEMPYREKVKVLIAINGPEKYIARVDLDNMVKTLLDCVKGILFIDDKQVFEIEATKHVQEPAGLMVGIRRL
jgi:Holliday junction resolvase RusA-like endonuclease